MDRRTVARATHLPFAVFVLCLGIVVAGLTDTFLGDLVQALVPDRAGLGGCWWWRCWRRCSPTS